MKIIEQYKDVDKNIKRGIALGNFDGVHLGHQKLIEILIWECKLKGFESCVHLFTNHPAHLISNANFYPVLEITGLEMKKKIFQSLCIDLLVLRAFDEELMCLSPDVFVKKILVEIFNCKTAVVGFDYTFGYKAAGNAVLLKELGLKYGFEVYIMDPFFIGREKVSSSKIRQYIREGNLEKANAFLGRPYTLNSRVVHGKGRGSYMGYPTANILIKPGQLIPGEGVYATIVEIDGTFYMGATCIGTNPTFGDNTITVETYIIDYKGTLYDQVIELQFIKRLRDMKKYNRVEELIKQMKQDVTEIKSYLQENINVLK